MTGQDNNANGRKACEDMTHYDSFHDLMISVQAVSNNQLPHSIDHFMEQTLSIKTQQHLLKSVNSGKLSVESIANAMIAAGDEANHGSVERVEDYLLRVL